MEKINRIEIRKLQEEDRFSRDSLLIDEEGNLVWDAHDMGKDPEQFFGKDEYEFDYTVAKDWKDSLLLLMAKDKFKNSIEYREWLEEKGVPFSSSSW